jgi:two-component system, OmpR family, copper resistance phosphate regulon response regulator CusR
MRILQVEDEPAAARMLAKGLREQGYAVDTAHDGAEATYKVAINQYDLIILDIVLRGQDGFSICRDLRSTGFSSPILMLTARDAVDDRVRGLDVGADDYLTKPFDYLELLARVRALLRRRPSPYVDVIEVGDLRVDIKARTVTRCNRNIDLTAKEYTILEYLASRKGQLVSREDLSEHAWDENFDPFSNLIEVYILRLRKKIDVTHTIKLLRTRRGEGYMLTAEPHAPAFDD